MERLDGKTALITGATSGIGLEASVQLAARGVRVVMVGRDPTKGARMLEEVKRRSGSINVALLLCDFSVQADIRRLAETYQAQEPRLDILVNNAGSVSDRRRVTVDGLEQTFAVNHLGYFLLTQLLVELLKKSAPARVVNVASIGHKRGDLDFDNLQYERGGYSTLKAYGRSKLANVLFTAELARRLAGKGVTVNCLHPGAVATAIWSRAPWYARPILAVAKKLMVTPEEGGARVVHLAASDEVAGRTGEYFEKNQPVTPAPLAQDVALAQKLWDVSARLVQLA
jgi:NAD(P)-dependent dehydrogenase (short-subunit alcohol dehydrogenase family)